MKRLIYLLAVMVAVQFTVFAQPKDSQGRNLAPMSDIDLTREQREELKVINTEIAEKMKTVKETYSDNPQIRHEKIKEVQREQVERRESVLNPEQLVKFRENMETLRVYREKKRAER